MSMSRSFLRMGSRASKLGFTQAWMPSASVLVSSTPTATWTRSFAAGSSQQSQSVTSLDMFEMMNAIFNSGSGGGMSSKVLKDDTKMRSVFDAIDSQRGGHLSRSDFATAASLCTMALSGDEIQGIFDAIDTNKSNTIEFSEFQKAIGKVVNLAGVDDLSKADASVKTVISLWNSKMSGNARAAQVFTSNLRKEPSLGTLQNVQLDRQVQMVYGMIGNAFQALGRPDNLTAVLKYEGARHQKQFKMDSTHYQAVSRSLFATLPEILGAEYTPQVKADFEKQFGIIQNALISGSG